MEGTLVLLHLRRGKTAVFTQRVSKEEFLLVLHWRRTEAIGSVLTEFINSLVEAVV